jgi:hypothetical protein
MTGRYRAKARTILDAVIRGTNSGAVILLAARGEFSDPLKEMLSFAGAAVQVLPQFLP